CIIYYSVSPFTHSFFALFLYCSPDHPDLHSFPTRRSSDLSSRHGVVQQLTTSVERISGITRSARDAAAGCSPSGLLRSAAIQRRSEEHTSELQSRGHLVCRLLLEKKKRDEFMVSIGIFVSL